MDDAAPMTAPPEPTPLSESTPLPEPTTLLPEPAGLLPEPTTPHPEPPAFPPRPVRDVRAVYARQAGCPSDLADVTVDFEPWEDGFAFEVAGDATVSGSPEPGDLAGFHAALAAGMQEELAGRTAGGRVAVAVVVRRTAVHAVDSRDRSFHEAGRLAVRLAFERLDGPPPRPKRRRA
ncbi:hypothetical protein [Kitasatospora sp. NPDC047058]|uniref:hypothetical protein n=1 Tax=Kitasatospora sp. NPDC047058 TaxID=3155620 RepID=UPI0033E5A843